MLESLINRRRLLAKNYPKNCPKLAKTNFPVLGLFYQSLNSSFVVMSIFARDLWAQ